MSEWIRIRVKDFYTDAIGETEYTYVTKEVYKALTETETISNENNRIHEPQKMRGISKRMVNIDYAFSLT